MVSVEVRDAIAEAIKVDDFAVDAVSFGYWLRPGQPKKFLQSRANVSHKHARSQVR